MSKRGGSRIAPGPLPLSGVTPPTLAWLQLGLGLLFLASFLFFGLWARFTVPYRDEWDWLRFLLVEWSSPLDFFRPHNEHVILVGRVLFAFQYAIDGMAGRVTFAVALLSYGLTSWLFWREIRARWSLSAARFVWGTTCVLLWSTFQLQSVVFGAATIFSLVLTWALVAFACALNASDPGRPSKWWLTAAAASAATAALTTTNGIVVPLIVAALLWVRRAPARVVAAFAAATVIGLLLYVAFVSRAVAASPLPPPGIAAMVAFFAAFFGTALAYVSVPLAVAVGTLVCGGCAWAATRTVIERDDVPRIELFAVAVMTLAALSAAMATPGRAAFGPLQAAQSRYTTFSLACWSALFVWMLSVAHRRGLEWRRRGLMVAITLACALALPVHLFIGYVWRLKADNVAASMLAVRTAVRDDVWVATLHPITSIVYEGAERLRRIGDPLVVDRRLGVMVPTMSLPACRATLTMSRLTPAGWRLRGSVLDDVVTGVVADRDGVVRGLVQPAPLLDMPAPPEPEFVRTAWDVVRGRSETGKWLGFVADGAGGPYLLQLSDREERPQCALTLP